MSNKEQDIKGYSFAINQSYCADDPISVVKASGEDASEFLQGQFTQDVSKLSDRELTYGFLLTQKGRVLGDAFLRRIDEENWKIFSWSLSAAALCERLEAYIIADDVELEDETDQWRAWLVGVGEGGAAAILESINGGFELDVAPSLSLDWRVAVLPKAQAPTWPASWQEVGHEVFESARIAAGWPRVPTDLGETDFPSEGGRHEHGVSYTKGCYLGQEVMARLAATGRLRRGLALVSGEGMPLAGEIELVQGGKTVGELRSRSAVDGGAGWVGLAMMQLARFDETKPVLTAGGEPVDFGGMVGA